MPVVKVEAPKCKCGRLKAEAQRRVYHSHDRHITSFLCDCGQEWTLEEVDVDPLDPVTSEEVLRVHEVLFPPNAEDDDRSLKDLLS